jgi:hypothetical protein
MGDLAIKWMAVPMQGAAVLITHLRNGSGSKMTVFENEIGVRQAAELLGKSRRRVQAMCDEGVLVEGRDWRKSDPRPSGRYLIKFDSVMKLRTGEPA